MAELTVTHWQSDGLQLMSIAVPAGMDCRMDFWSTVAGLQDEVWPVLCGAARGISVDDM
jgi:hypothetical protein